MSNYRLSKAERLRRATNRLLDRKRDPKRLKTWIVLFIVAAIIELYVPSWALSALVVLALIRIIWITYRYLWALRRHDRWHGRAYLQ